MKKTILILFSFLCFGFLNAQTCKQKTLWHCYTFNPGEVPKFPGGDTALQNYVAKNLGLNKHLHKDATGIVIKLSFDVDSLGKIWNVKSSNAESEEPEIRQAAVDLICTMPDWIPGIIRYRDDSVTYASNVEMHAEIHFRNTENGIEKPAFIVLSRLSKSILYKPKPGDTEPFRAAEKMPEYPGGFSEYLRTHIKYPVMEKDLGHQGTVYINFIVEKDGSISDIYAVKEVEGAPGLTNEAIDLFASMPKWTPGLVNGQPVRVIIVQPVRFVLQ